MKNFLIFISIIAVIGVLLIGGFFLKVALLPYFGAQKTIETGYEIVDETMTGENAIYNYEWFKQQIEDIRAIEKKIINAQSDIDEFKEMSGEKTNWDYEDKNEYSRINSIHTGLKNQLEDMVATYNARSKMANRNIFNDDLMPSFLEIGMNVLTK